MGPKLHSNIHHSSIYSESVGRLIFAGIAANIEEIGGKPAVQLDDVHGRHCQTGSIHHTACKFLWGFL